MTSRRVSLFKTSIYFVENVILFGREACGGADYSARKLFTGFINAALIAWKLTVAAVMTNAASADKINTPGPIVIR